MRTPYLRGESVFPIPAISVRVGRVDSPRWLDPMQAELDTGADITVMPIALLDRLRVPATGEGALLDAWGERHAVSFFLIDLEVGTVKLPGVLVTADAEIETIILGRNVLNKLPLFLDGPNNTPKF